MKTVYYPQAKILEWASVGLYGYSDGFDLEKDKAIGIEKESQLICAVCYSNYQTTTNRQPLSIEMSIYSVDKRWATRQNLRDFFTYPFIQLGVKRVLTICSAHDQGVIMFNKRIGFMPEGYHRDAFPDGGDAVSFGMLKKECKWLFG